MRLEYDNFILARVGYNPKYKKNVSWEELKNSFSLYKRIPMIVAGGDHYGPIDPNNTIGFVDAEIDDVNQVINGVPTFFNNKFEKIPAEIQQMLAHKKHVPASLGYEPFGDVRKIDHIAIGVKSPVFEDIGFNAENSFQYEETEGMNKPAEEGTDAPAEPKQAAFVTKEDFLSFKNEVLEAIKAQQAPPKPEATEEVEAMEPEEDDEEIQEPPEEVPAVQQPKPKVEPERKLPRETESKTIHGMFKVDGDTRIISQPLGGTTKKQSQDQQ